MTKHILLIIMVVTLARLTAKSQPGNLVINGSFEAYDSCPNYSSYYDGTLISCQNWFQPNTARNSSDYFNSCDQDTNYLSVPNNFCGYQIARSGDAYAGVSPGSILAPLDNWREYIESELKSPLNAGSKYLIRFFVSCPNNVVLACDAMGLYLSDTIVLYNDSSMHGLIITPQVANPTNNIIADTVNWTEISDTIIANGGEKYITIGNFKTNSAIHSSIIPIPNGISASYYYIDDVAVIPVDSLLASTNESQNLDFSVSIFKESSRLDFNFGTPFNGEIAFYDLTGRLLNSWDVNNTDKLTADINFHEHAMYILAVIDSKQNIRITRKIVF